MEKLCLKDKKLLYWLDQDSRATNRQLGKKVGLTEQAIGYKLKRLQEKGIIKKFVAFINTLSLGYQHYKVFIKLQNASEEKEKEIISFLIKNKNIRWVVSTSGKYDLSFSVLAKTPMEFVKIYRKIESAFGRYIIEKNISINVSSPGFTRDWLINSKTSKQLEYQTNDKVQQIDEIDEKILKVLSQEARKNIVDIAQVIKSTVDVVKYRIKKLKENKIINGFSIQLDLEKIGCEYYSVFFNLHNIDESFEKSTLFFAGSHPNVLFVVKVIGSYDLQIEFEVKNYYELEKNLKEFREQFSQNIRDFEILRVIKEYKYDFFPF